MKERKESGDIMFNIGTIWRWVVRFRSRALVCSRRLDGP